MKCFSNLTGYSFALTMLVPVSWLQISAFFVLWGLGWFAKAPNWSIEPAIIEIHQLAVQVFVRLRTQNSLGRFRLVCHFSWQPWRLATGDAGESCAALFSFLYLKKIKISKIYVRFELFQKYPIGRQALSVIFFLQICNEVPGKKGACRPCNGRQGPVARWGGDRVPSP